MIDLEESWNKNHQLIMEGAKEITLIKQKVIKITYILVKQRPVYVAQDSQA